MNRHYTYLAIDVLSFLFPIIFTFHKKIAFYKNWRAVFPALILSAAVFIAWDVIFTNRNIWQFNSSYTIGLNIINLPVEEWLFFIFIPYAFMFTYYSVNKLTQWQLTTAMYKSISIALAILVMAVAVINPTKLYTSITFLATGLFLITILLLRVKWLSSFYITYIIILIPFFITNGILTGSSLQQPVVIYNANDMLGIRLLTIPIEDTIYALLLFLLNCTVCEYLLNKKQV